MVKEHEPVVADSKNIGYENLKNRSAPITINKSNVVTATETPYFTGVIIKSKTNHS